MDVRLDSSNFTARALRQESFTDVARHGVPSWRSKTTGRWSSKKWMKDIAKLIGFSVSTSLDEV